MPKCNFLVLKLRIDIEYSQIKSGKTLATVVNRQCCKICWWASHLTSVNATYRYYRFQDVGYGSIEIMKVYFNVEIFSVFINKGLRTIVFA